MPDIKHLVRISARRDRVFQAITTSEGIRNWWTRDALIEPEVGATGEFGFCYGERLVTKVKVAELRPRVIWKTIESFRPEWQETTIIFDLREEGEMTAVHFTHANFKNSDEVYALTTTGWGYYLVSLMQYLEKGQGAPSPDVDFARMIEKPN